MDDLPVITSDDDWLDMRVGERGVVAGRLDSVTPSGDLLISYPDWRQLAVPIEPCDMPVTAAVRAELERSAVGRRVRLAVTRGEDGPTTTWADIGDLDVSAE